MTLRKLPEEHPDELLHSQTMASSRTSTVLLHNRGFDVGLALDVVRSTRPVVVSFPFTSVGASAAALMSDEENLGSDDDGSEMPDLVPVPAPPMDPGTTTPPPAMAPSFQFQVENYVSAARVLRHLLPTSNERAVWTETRMGPPPKFHFASHNPEQGCAGPEEGRGI